MGLYALDITPLMNDRSQIKLIESFIDPTAYSCLTTIPPVEHGFYLDKTTFWDSICYVIPLTYLPSSIVSGQIFNL